MTQVIGLTLIIGGIIYMGLTGAFERRNNNNPDNTAQGKYAKLKITFAAIIVLAGVYLLQRG